MNTPSSPSSPSHSAVSMPEKVNRQWVESNRNLAGRATGGRLVLDLSRTTQIDSSGVSLLRVVDRELAEAGGRLILRNVSPAVRTILQTWRSSEEPREKGPGKQGLFVSMGERGLRIWDTGRQAAMMLSEILYWGSFGLIKRRDFRRGVLGEQMYQLGFNALGVVGLLAFLIGIVLALQTAMQLRLYGAGVFLAPMIGISMIRELGPLMTAIILAGRSGSATTAEIATMVVGEEVDALQTMGINPIQFIVVPKFWAITLTMPLLSIMATVTGIVGGYLVSLLYLDIASSLFWGELFKNLFLKDFMAGFIKSIVFSWLIIWVAAFFGFKVRGGAEEVGRETTACVVAAIFVIIVADAVFSFII